jgi:hypothetical protein
MTDALRQAAQQALDFVGGDAWGSVPYMDGRVYEDAARLRDALRAALEAEPAGESPIAREGCHYTALPDMVCTKCGHVHGFSSTPQRTPEPAGEPEPYLYCYEYDGVMGLHREFYPRLWNGMQHDRAVPLYRRPQKRRQMLGQDEIIRLWGDRSDGPSNNELISFARAIERAIWESSDE